MALYKAIYLIDGLCIDVYTISLEEISKKRRGEGIIELTVRISERAVAQQWSACCVAVPNHDSWHC